MRIKDRHNHTNINNITKANITINKNINVNKYINKGKTRLKHSRHYDFHYHPDLKQDIIYFNVSCIENSTLEKNQRNKLINSVITLNIYKCVGC